MELVNPGLGLIFWMTLAFGAVFYILKKFAWPIIIQALKDRERHIEEALQAADRAHEEMKKMQLDNEALLKKAKEERDQIMQEARKLRDKMLEESRIKANEEADRIVENAKVRIENERKAAMTDIKNQIAKISIEIAEMVLREKMKSTETQKAYIDKLIEDRQLN
ncbi:MAG: F0F1 ATP synthase subunit B [Bacteroidales bacterium]|jgi:F-type H+-transporting ATPase subunit b|nr:F0F1 ATP synthase subunit B [Bacteroidales bacterium]MDN5349515.1 F-type H+-transporting ATPase subunit b [Bacteroidales bacterium]